MWGLLLLLGLNSGCHSSSKEEAKTTNSTDSTNHHLLDQAKFDTARIERVNNELNLTGKVSFNQDQVVKVFPLVGGHIETVRVALGDFVHKGQLLSVIRSGDLADLEQQRVTAKSNLLMAQKNMQVTEDMAKAGLSSQRDLVASREQLMAAQGELKRVGERQRILGGSGSTYSVKAPTSGFIVEKTASPGMELRSDDPENLFTISNLDHVWVLADVYESDIAYIHEGVPAIVTTISYPDKEFRGKIDKIFNVLDANSKTMKVRVTLNNAGFQLKPEMFANVTVLYAGRDERVSIPANALVFDKNRNFIVVVDAKNQPLVREVDIYKIVGPNAYLNSGITPGERVVTTNQLLIYNALSH